MHDPDGPSPEDLERFGDEFVTCPECGSLVYDQAEMCQACGYALMRPDGGLPRWALAAAGLAILGIVLFAVL